MHQLTWAQVRNLIRFSYQRLREGRLPQVAGSLTFTTVLALVPVLTIALAIFTAFPLFNSYRTSLEAYFIKSLMPKEISATILGYLTQFATKATRLSAVGGVALMFTAVATMAMIDKTFNQIWRVKRRRPLVHRTLVYWAIVTLGPLLIGVSITFTSYVFKATSGVVGAVPFIGAVFYTVVSVLFTAFAFTLLYLAVPNRTVYWRDAAWGALFAALAFEIAKRIFAVFVVKFPTYTVVYGALAAVPIFLLWIYLSWLITLIGAVIAATLPVFKSERWWHVPSPGSQYADAMEILKILNQARLDQADAAVDINTLRAKTRFGLDEIDGLLEKMLEIGWVGKLIAESPSNNKRRWIKRKDEGTDRWVLLANPLQLKLADVYRLFVFDTDGRDPLVRQVKTLIEEGLQQSLQEHFAQVH